MYSPVDPRLCWSHIPHCWKYHVTAQIKLDILAAHAYSVKCTTFIKNKHTNSSANLTKLSLKQSYNLKAQKFMTTKIIADALKDNVYGIITSVTESLNIESTVIAQ